jgi:hypothetical protein
MRMTETTTATSRIRVNKRFRFTAMPSPNTSISPINISFFASVHCVPYALSMLILDDLS